MPPEAWQKARRILAIRLDNIGDVVMTGPALRALRVALPAAELTLLASPVGARVAPLLPWVDQVWTHRALWQDTSQRLCFDPARELAFIEALRAARFDAVVVFTSFSQSPFPPAYACYLAGIPLRAGQARDFGGGVLSTAVTPPPDDAHQVDRNLHLVRALGFDASDDRMQIDVPIHVQARADAVLADVGIRETDAFIAVAPGASCAARRYDAERFAEVARRLAQRLPIVVLADASEATLVPAADGIVSLAGRVTVPELAGVLARAELVVANNSGPMHLADALARPCVALFSGTELERQWAPRRSPLRLLRRPTACTPCYGFTCPYHMECLDIPAHEVVEAALEVLAPPSVARAVHGDNAQGERRCVRSAY
jgi:ADP-heptose:LPS heptosyltransferase